MIKVFIFDRNGGLFDVVRDIFKGDWSAAIVGINFVKKFAMTVKDLSANRRRFFGEFARVGNIFEDKVDSKQK